MRLKLIAGSVGLAGFLLLSSSVQAADNGPTRPVASGGVLSSLLAAPVVGQPFTAVQVHETKRTLSDGTVITHNGHHAIARDAQGRVHVELRMANGENGKPDEVIVFVIDPVAHILTTWVQNAPGQAKTAAFFKLPAEGVPPAGTPEAELTSPTTTESTRPQPTITVQDLGVQQIEGIDVTGKRTTTIVPPGRSGNNMPITKVHDVWTSPDLQLVIRQHWTDPRMGERTVELKNIAKANPDPALFRAPAGYDVKSASETLKQLEEKLDAQQQ
jgi:hypothetical protein